LGDDRPIRRWYDALAWSPSREGRSSHLAVKSRSCKMPSICGAMNGEARRPASHGSAQNYVRGPAPRALAAWALAAFFAAFLLRCGLAGLGISSREMLPPAASIRARAMADTLCADMCRAFSILPLPSTFNSPFAWRGRINPFSANAVAVTVAPAWKTERFDRLTTMYSLRNGFLKPPRYGMRCEKRFWPPSKCGRAFPPTPGP